jgi:hypothetical protein
MPFPQFNRDQLRLQPLAQRDHDLDHVSCMVYPDSPRTPFDHPALNELAERIVTAARAGRAVIFACGAHVLRKGNGPLLIDLMQRGLLSVLALNGAGAIHDFELAMIGATTESVARYVKSGEFGLWNETGLINDAVNAGHRDGLGLGESLGRAIEQGQFPYRETSVLAASVRLGVPVTIHIGMGQDIVHMYPNFDPAAAGAASYTDFLIFAEAALRLEGGAFLNFGTAVMGPEIYLKVLTMARNVAHQRGEEIRHFVTAVFDLPDLGDELNREAPKSDPRYYFRPYKSVLVRTVADGGKSYYVQGDHALTFPALYDRIIKQATA